MKPKKSGGKKDENFRRARLEEEPCDIILIEGMPKGRKHIKGAKNIEGEIRRDKGLSERGEAKT